MKIAELGLPYVLGTVKFAALELNADYCRSQELPYTIGVVNGIVSANGYPKLSCMI